MALEKSENLSRGEERRAPEPLVAERPQPHDREAERAVLSAMLRNSDNANDVVEFLGENPAMFYSNIHREIFEAIMELRRDNTKVDLVVLASALERRGTLARVGGEAFLVELRGAIATAANLEAWCNILRDKYCLRRMIAVCTESTLRCYDADTPPSEIIDKVEKSVFDVRNSTERSQMIPLAEGLAPAFQHLIDLHEGKIKSGIMTGFPKLDAMTGGLKPGEMFVLAARPSIGKTAMALNIIRNVALANEPSSVLFFSLEMSAEQIIIRLICTEADIPESKFRDRAFNSRSDMAKLTGAISDLQKTKVFIDPTPALSIGAVQARSRRAKQQHDIDLIVIDYLTLMNYGGRTDSRQNEVAEVSRGIKQLAKDLNVPVLVLAQLNRDSESGNDPNALPKLSHLRESGAIEQDADVVAFIHRDRLNDVSDEQAAKGLPAKLVVAKNRNGQTGIMEMTFYPRRMMFAQATKYSAADHAPEP